MYSSPCTVPYGCLYSFGLEGWLESKLAAFELNQRPSSSWPHMKKVLPGITLKHAQAVHGGRWRVLKG